MNDAILNTEIQDFINSNIKSNSFALALKGTPFKGVDIKSIIEQIEAKKRCEKKLPLWFKTKNIYYANKLNIEQTSSELTANYKANLVSGKRLIDLTGGFGVDTFYFSKQITHVTHCEIDFKLSKIATHNFNILNATNITSITKSGIDVLKDCNQNFDWMYIDPSRRNDAKQKVFLLSDCLPNVKAYQSLFLKHAKHVMIKTSPLLDIKRTLLDLKYVKEIHIIAINNEVKELLWVLEGNYANDVVIKTINIGKKNEQQTFSFSYTEEFNTSANYSLPCSYLYEPNSAILKAGAFNIISRNLKVFKLHKHSHLYTSAYCINFPGRRFKIKKIITYNKKELAKERISKANITTRNFPLTVDAIRKKLKIKDGGDIYLFFTTDADEKKVILICSKV